MARNLIDALARAGIDPPHIDPVERDPRTPPSTVCCIDLEEVQPGLVVMRMDPSILLGNGVRHTQDPPVERPGPFLCLTCADPEQTAWAPLTTKHRHNRLVIRQGWRTSGTARWRSERHFLSDGASVWVGKVDHFVAASWEETQTARGRRSRITVNGLRAVHREVEKQRHRRHRD